MSSVRDKLYINGQRAQAPKGPGQAYSHSSLGDPASGSNGASKHQTATVEGTSPTSAHCLYGQAKIQTLYHSAVGNPAPGSSQNHVVTVNEASSNLSHVPSG